MLPTCVNRYKLSQFYEGLLRNTSRTKTVMECSVKLQYQQSFPELVIILFFTTVIIVIILFFTTVIIGVIWTFAYFYRIKGHYHLMEDQELTSSGQNQYEARLLMDRLEQNGLLLKF
uniref:SAYSvFN domain-containing protein n=1 Tax=Steinernema glaseri TaxID=37863 RepID=A0A1I8A1Z1_9BILA